MERIGYTVDLLDEARRLIQLGTVSHLRMALTLLDNAAEILMYRAIRDALGFNEMYLNMHKRAESIADPEARARFVEGLRKPILPNQQRKLERFFPEKVDFLVEPTILSDEPLLDRRTGRALKAIHRYRNQSYHQDTVGAVTLRPAVLLLFEIVCELFEVARPAVLSLGGSSEASKAERKRLEGRFGGDLMDVFLNPDFRAKIAAELRADLPLSVEDLRETLAQHVDKRVEDLREALRQIAEYFETSDDPEVALKRIQFWDEDRERAPFQNEAAFRAYRPRVTFETLDGWVREAEDWANLNDKLVLFGRFADVEEALEPVEELVGEVSLEMDQQIQHAIDVSRGK